MTTRAPLSGTLLVGALAMIVLVAMPSCHAPAAVLRSPALLRPAPIELRPPEAFAAIADRDACAQALFLEASRVFFHPRCVNCHPSDDAPRQRDDAEAHEPPVSRGDDDRGIPALRCSGCHQDENLELARVPGASDWRLAPRSMAWAGKTPAAVCA